jgi:membrane protease YdiL (CAAX protease family)
MSSGPIAVLLNDVLFFVIPLVVAWKLGLLDLSTEFRNGRDTFSKMKLPILVGVLWFFADSMLEDLCGIEMPEELQKTFKELMHSPIGAFGICVAGPILEELLMRTAILGLMLRGGVKPWVAIVISALVFGLMHMNLAQFVFASIGGLMLGFVYYKTNNIFSVMIIHIIQNTFATVMALSMERMGYEDEQIHDTIGVPAVVVLLIVFASGSVYFLKRLCSQFPQPQFVESVESVEPVTEEC